MRTNLFWFPWREILIDFIGVFDAFVIMSREQIDRIGWLLIALGGLHGDAWNLRAGTNSTSYGISFQVNVNAAGQNIAGDAANEPSMCIDPANPNRMAVGWRQFDSTNSSFRQGGVAYTTNGGLNWTFPGNLEAGAFRSHPGPVAAASGAFFFLGISYPDCFASDL